MSCIHTGANVVIHEYQERVRCDIFRIEDIVIIRAASPVEMCAVAGPDDYVIQIGQGHWFDRHDPYGLDKHVYNTSTIVIPVHNFMQIPQDELDRW